MFFVYTNIVSMNSWAFQTVLVVNNWQLFNNTLLKLFATFLEDNKQNKVSKIEGSLMAFISHLL